MTLSEQDLEKCQNITRLPSRDDKYVAPKNTFLLLCKIMPYINTLYQGCVDLSISNALFDYLSHLPCQNNRKILLHKKSPSFEIKEMQCVTDFIQ